MGIAQGVAMHRTSAKGTTITKVTKTATAGRVNKQFQ